MTAQTIQRAFHNPTNLILNAKEKSNPFAYSIKKFFYNLFTLGFGKAIEEERSERRENEIVRVVFDTLNGLPEQYEDLDKLEYESKIIHTNFDKKYQIIQEKEELCLYTGTVSQFGFNGIDHFDKDMNSRTVLIKFCDTGFSSFKNELTKVEENSIFKELKEQQQAAIKIQSFFKMCKAKREFNFVKNEITSSMEYVNKLPKNLTLKDCIIFGGGPRGNFNDSWEAYLTNINSNNFKIKQIELEGSKPYKVFNRNNAEEYILIDERGGSEGGSSGELRGLEVVNLIKKFFKKENKTLKDFLYQPVKTTNSPHFRYLLNGYKNMFEWKNKQDLFPFFRKKLELIVYTEMY